MSALTRLTLEVAKRILPPSRFATVIPSGSTGRHAVYLTFDDGPHPEHTPRLLETLAKTGIKATFFVIGERARQHPALLKRIIGDGHSLGSHSWSHWSCRSVATKQWLDDIKRGRETVEGITGRPCPLFRPPYGELTPLALLGLMLEDYRVIHWSQDTKDFRFDHACQLNHWFETSKATPGTVVLMHEQALTSEHLHDALAPWRHQCDFLAIR